MQQAPEESGKPGNARATHTPFCTTELALAGDLDTAAKIAASTCAGCGDWLFFLEGFLTFFLPPPLVVGGARVVVRS